MTTGTVSFHRVLAAPPERVYRAFLDPESIAKWMPPHGFTCKVFELDPTVGGRYRMHFTNIANGQSHAFGGQYVELVPNERIVNTDVFEDTQLPGEMRTTMTFQPVPCGTELRIVQEGIPAMIPLDGCHVGWQQSLQLLALLVEAQVPA